MTTILSRAQCDNLIPHYNDVIFNAMTSQITSSPVLLLRHDAVAGIVANGNAAFMKAALPLAGILATASDRCRKTGPSLTIVYSTVYSGADQRKHQSSASLALVRGIHRWLMNSPHKGPVMRKMFPFDDVIMICQTAPPLIHIHMFQLIISQDRWLVKIDHEVATAKVKW